MFDSWLYQVSDVHTHSAVISLAVSHEVVEMYLLIFFPELPERPVGNPHQSPLWRTLRRKRGRGQRRFPGMVPWRL